MPTHRLGRICVSVLLFMMFATQWVVPVKAIQIENAKKFTAPTDPPKPKIVSTDQGISKLAPDLRALVAANPLPGPGLAMDQSSPDPLLVTAMIQPGADVSRFFVRSVRSREVAGTQWVTGQIRTEQLRKLASMPDVIGVTSINTYQTAEAPDLNDLRMKPASLGAKELRSLLAQGGPSKVIKRLDQIKQTNAAREKTSSLAPRVSTAAPTLSVGTIPGILDIHDVRAARAEGYTGDGVVVAMVDTGVDFAHPDLQGTEARVKSGPYAGWPFAYDTVSAALYAMDPKNTMGPEDVWSWVGLTQYVHTLPVPLESDSCDQFTCSADLILSGDKNSSISGHFKFPNTSKSGKYYYSVLPDYDLPSALYNMGIRYPDGIMAQPPVVVSDEHQPSVYDTVYVDINENTYLGDPGEKLTREAPYGGTDLNEDGIWDLSSGMLGWISDGVHQPPGVETVYPQTAKFMPPAAGRLLVFNNDMGGHGTNCASQIVGQGKITDPQGRGYSNPLFAGGANVGGVGGAVIESIAPGAKIAAFENGFQLPLDAWTIATLGFDGNANTGDEANIVSNSWGDSDIITDGWDPVSRFAHKLVYEVAPDTSFLVATGNGGHGYGTVTTPGGGPIIDVGASTEYGNLRAWEFVKPDQFLYGEVQPWSNRGPGMLGDIAPDILAVGAYGTGANPLNQYYGDGQQAYDIFGGTSMATPVAAGNLALVYQAYHNKNNRWPSWSEARSILLGTAQDLGYDVLTQGAGNIQAGRAVAVAEGKSPLISPVQWMPGNYRGSQYPAFPALLHAGESDEQTFSITNPTSEPITAAISGDVYRNIQDKTFSYSFSPPPPKSWSSQPIYLADLSQLIIDNQPDLVRAQVIFPYSAFDADKDLYADTAWSVYFYDWLDRNNDGNLWTDTNRDGMVQDGEIDIESKTGLYEFNRFTYADPQGTYIEASLGKEGLAQAHNGVYLGLKCSFCGASTSLQVRVTFYKKTAWNWLSLSTQSLIVAPGETNSFKAKLSIPTDTKLGAYDGALTVNIGGHESTLPVIANIAANSATFQFGGQNELASPYDNNHLFGGFNWKWRYESGDWRNFYFDVPDGTAGPGKAMIVDTHWNDPKTDVDTWISGSTRADESLETQALLGPQGMQVNYGSVDNLIYNGKFRWMTNTGYAREIVGGPIQDGLGMVTLHNILNGGAQFAETLTGRAYQVSTSPGQVNLDISPDGVLKPYLSASQEIQVTSTGDMDEGLTIQAYGLSTPVTLQDQTIQRGEPYNICSSNWVYRAREGGLKISHGGMLDIKTDSSEPGLDLDIFLYQDDGDGVLNCSKDHLVAVAQNGMADEQIKMYHPEDGDYWIVVYGSTLPKDQVKFDFQVNAVQGTALTLKNTPIGPIHANQPVTFTTTVQSFYPTTAPQIQEGLLLIGLPTDPDLIEIPIQVRPTILLYPAPSLLLKTPWIRQSIVPVNLSFQNVGAQSETAQVKISLPEGLNFEAGSAVGPGTPPIYDPATRILSWEGSVPSGQKIDLMFNVSALPDFLPRKAVITAQVNGIISQQSWTVNAPIWINEFGLMLPIIRH